MDALRHILKAPLLLAGLRSDVVFAWRLSRRQPASTAFAIAGMAIAIGFGTAVFCLVNAVALRGIGVVDPATVVKLSVPNDGPWSTADYLTVRGTVSTTIDVAAAAFQDPFSAVGFRTVPVGDDLERQPAAGVSGNYFSLLGGRAALGRVLSTADDLPDADHVVVLSHAFWSSKLGADPSIVGRTVWVFDRPVTVIGIAERAFIGPSERQAVAPALWMTISTQRALRREFAATLKHPPTSGVLLDWDYVHLFGRLRPGVSPLRASADVNAIATELSRGQGRALPANRPLVILTPIWQMSDGGRRAVTGTFVMVTLVLLIASANVAGLLLARALGRRQEIGTRLALGASWLRLARQLVVECLLLAVIGGSAGAVVGAWSAPLLAHAMVLTPGIDFSPDVSVFVFAAAVTIVAAMLAGAAPVRHGLRRDVLTMLKGDSSSTPGGAASGRLRAWIIGAQAAACVIVLLATALVGRAMLTAEMTDLGQDTDHLVAIRANFMRVPDARIPAFWPAAVERVRQLPGVEATGLAVATFGGFWSSRGGAPGLPTGHYYDNWTSPDYFAAAGVRLLRGRIYTDAEVRTSAPVTVISEGIAKQFWPNEDPLGARMTRVWGDKEDPPGTPIGSGHKPAGARVIGIVSDTRSRSTDDAAMVYFPVAPTETDASLVVRVAGDPTTLTAPIRSALLAIDADVKLQITFASDSVNRDLNGFRGRAIVASITGMCALVLAALGLGGATAFAVIQRRHEISVRVALGAAGSAVTRMMVHDGLRPVVLGAIVGTASGLAFAGPTVEAYLGLRIFHLTRLDPLAITAALLVLIAVAALAAFLPARAAARIDPIEMLKQS